MEKTACKLTQSIIDTILNEMILSLYIFFDLKITILDLKINLKSGSLIYKLVGTLAENDIELIINENKCVRVCDKKSIRFR